MPHDLDEDAIGRLRGALNTAVMGQSFTDVASRVADLPNQFSAGERAAVSSVLATLLETVVERHEERVVLGGTVNLARAGGDFSTNLEPVLEALEEQMVLLRLLSEQSGAVNPVSVHRQREQRGGYEHGICCDGGLRNSRPTDRATWGSGSNSNGLRRHYGGGGCSRPVPRAHD